MLVLVYEEVVFYQQLFIYSPLCFSSTFFYFVGDSCTVNQCNMTSTHRFSNSGHIRQVVYRKIRLASP